MSSFRIQYVLVFAMATLAIAGCSSQEHGAIVARVGDKPITLKEYEDLYIKSNGSRDSAAKSSMEDRQKFLDLVTKFKLKLADAYRQGLDKKPELLGEIGQYKSSLAQSFLTEREISGPGAKHLFDNRHNEYRASHILLKLGQHLTKEDSVAVYAKADSIIAKLNAGAVFESLAVKYSEDPSVSQNNGDLYYFTAGQMVPPFEDAVFSMKVGEITQKPVRTQFGLHIIKLVDKKPARGEIHASHIMIRFERQNPPPEDTLAAYKKILAIQDSLKMGVDFAELAKRNSGDPGSASKGGDLGWFGRRRWIQSFDEVAQTLKPGQLSGVVRTIYGYHIIKCTDEHPPKTFEESKKEMQQLYQQTRFQEDYKTYYANLKKETNFKLHEDALERFISSCDSTKTTRDSAWWSVLPESVRSSALVTFGPRVVSVDSVIKLIGTHQEFGNMPLRDEGIRNMVDKVAESLVFGVKAETLDKKYPEFDSIMKEYNDGILLYQIEQDQVWNKVSVTDSALHSYFDAHRDIFMFPDRVDFTELRAASDSVAQFLYAQTRAGKTLEELASADSLRMARKTDYTLSFKTNSSRLAASDTRALTPVLSELHEDALLRVQLTAHPDTSTKKSQNQKVATRRIDAIKAFLKKNGVAESRVLVITQPYNRKSMSDGSQEKNAWNLEVKVSIVGRRAEIVGKLETSILPVTSDERTAKADSLKPGEVSAPFRSKFGISLVRLNKRDPLRQKTFEEAGTEVSSSFQEYESKRLENQWIDGLRKQYPVVEYKEVLTGAFAPTN
jgi:peptidyl-prolyl cis-trans isomerase SurA